MGFCTSQYERRYMHRRAHSATVRSAETGRVVTTVKLPSKPETSAVDPRVAEYSSMWKIRARSSRRCRRLRSSRLVARLSTARSSGR
jgi:hypothetical protein